MIGTAGLDGRPPHASTHLGKQTSVTTLSSSAGRVAGHTSDEINDRIRWETDRRVAVLARIGPQAIEARLMELDREWDIERCLETGAASLMLVGSLLRAGSGGPWRPVQAVPYGRWPQCHRQVIRI